MRKVVLIVKLILLLAIVLLAVLFNQENTSVLTLSLFGYQSIGLPIAAWLVIALLIGFVLALLMIAPRLVRISMSRALDKQSTERSE